MIHDENIVWISMLTQNCCISWSKGYESALVFDSLTKIMEYPPENGKRNLCVPGQCLYSGIEEPCQEQQPSWWLTTITDTVAFVCCSCKVSHQTLWLLMMATDQLSWSQKNNSYCMTNRIQRGRPNDLLTTSLSAWPRSHFGNEILLDACSSFLVGVPVW